MAGGLQVSGDEPLRQDMQQQIAHLVPLPFIQITCCRMAPTFKVQNSSHRSP